MQTTIVILILAAYLPGLFHPAEPPLGGLLIDQYEQPFFAGGNDVRASVA